MNVLIFGISGMIGNTFFRDLFNYKDINVFGTVRTFDQRVFFPKKLREKILLIDNFMDEFALEDIFQKTNPDFIINCSGIIKQNMHVNDPLETVPVNSLFPHKLIKYCEKYSAKLIQFSTDCVFSGQKGSYKETDIPDANDLYGMSKIIGEVNSNKNVLTIRTSVIGHELIRKTSFLDWVVNSQNQIDGYKYALYSGLTAHELVKVTFHYIFKNNLCGLYHISSNYISKYELIKIICETYKKEIIIKPNDFIKIDRTLDCQKFQLKTGYSPSNWKSMIKETYESYNLYK